MVAAQPKVMSQVAPLTAHLSRAFFLAATLMVAELEASTNLPTGGTVTVGEGSISNSGSALTVTQTSDKLAINWDSFSIGADASVHFSQPSAASVALNRVTGADASVIEGKLTANGHVFLLNPSGVLFAKSAQVNVGGLVATTLNLSDDDFVAGNYTFSEPGAGVVTNEGSLVAVDGGSISLIAAQVINTGDILAEGGAVNLAAGSRVTLNLGGLVNVLVDEGVVDAVVRNGGAIRANGGLVLLTARGAGELAAAAISNDGLIEARTLATGEYGQIELRGDVESGDKITLGGRLDVTAPDGGNGGFIFTSAQKIELTGGLELDGRSANGLVGAWIPSPNLGLSSGLLGSLVANIQLILPTVCPGPVTVDPVVIVDPTEGDVPTVWPIFAYSPGVLGGGVISLGDSMATAHGSYALDFISGANVEFTRVAFGERSGAIINPALTFVGSSGVLVPGSGIKLDLPHVDGLSLGGGVIGDE